MQCTCNSIIIDGFDRLAEYGKSVMKLIYRHTNKNNKLKLDIAYFTPSLVSADIFFIMLICIVGIFLCILQVQNSSAITIAFYVMAYNCEIKG